MTWLLFHLSVLFLFHVLVVRFHVIDWPIKYQVGGDARES